MKILLTIITLLSITTTASATASMKASALVGVWRLVKSENPGPGGTSVPYCNGVHGYLIYTADGYVSVSLNCGPRIRPTEPADISGRRFFYAGKYSVNASEVTHYIENASDTQLIGTNFKREVSFYGYELVLKGENQGQEFSATWQKVSADEWP